jgi:hypothetical protein
VVLNEEETPNNQIVFGQVLKTLDRRYNKFSRRSRDITRNLKKA